MKTCLNCGFENVDQARYCQNCSFVLDWEPTPAPVPNDKEKTVVMPVVPEPVQLAVALEPRVARVDRSGSVRVRVGVRKLAGPDVEAALRVSGPAAADATLDPASLWLSGDEEKFARLELSPPARSQEPASYDVAAEPLQTGAEAARAEGLVAPARWGRDRGGGGTPAWAWAGLAALAALAVVVAVLVIDGGGGVDGRVPRAANVRARASFFSERVGRLAPGTAVVIACQTDGPGQTRPVIRWDRLEAPGEHAGRFVADGLVERETEPREC